MNNVISRWRPQQQPHSWNIWPLQCGLIHVSLANIKIVDNRLNIINIISIQQYSTLLSRWTASYISLVLQKQQLDTYFHYLPSQLANRQRSEQHWTGGQLDKFTQIGIWLFHCDHGTCMYEWNDRLSPWCVPVCACYQHTCQVESPLSNFSDFSPWFVQLMSHSCQKTNKMQQWINVMIGDMPVLTFKTHFRVLTWNGSNGS